MLKFIFPLHITVWRQKKIEQMQKTKKKQKNIITSMWRKMQIEAIVILKKPILSMLPAVYSSAMLLWTFASYTSDKGQSISAEWSIALR